MVQFNSLTTVANVLAEVFHCDNFSFSLGRENKECSVPTTLSTTELRTLARYGATARIQELQAEIAAIRAAFPDVKGVRDGRRSQTAGTVMAVRGRKRHTMSAAARRAVSVRMKKYWAARRKAK